MRPDKVERNRKKTEVLWKQKDRKCERVQLRPSLTRAVVLGRRQTALISICFHFCSIRKVVSDKVPPVAVTLLSVCDRLS